MGGRDRARAKNPSYEKLMDLATALDVRISELIAEADDG